MSDEDFRLDNPMLVRWEFASEERLEKRNALYRRLVEGINAEEVLFDGGQGVRSDARARCRVRRRRDGGARA